LVNGDWFLGNGGIFTAHQHLRLKAVKPLVSKKFFSFSELWLGKYEQI